MSDRINTEIQEKNMWQKILHVFPLSWGNTEDRMTLGPNMLAQMEKMVQQIKQNLNVSWDRQKNDI